MEKRDNILTILIPCYNGEKYIRRCLNSLDGIKSSELVFLFINDGSEDDSPKIIEEWVKKRRNAILINKKNGGYCSAINAGLDRCDSEYFMILGVDDEVYASGIDVICNHLVENRPDILAFTTMMINDDEHDVDEIDPHTYYKHPGLFKTDLYSLYNEYKNDVRILFTRDTSRCFKLSTIGDLRYYGSTGVSADGCFSTLVACKSKSFEFINEKGYRWHIHNDSVSSRKKTEGKLLEEADVWNSFFTKISEDESDQKIAAPIVSMFFVYTRLIKSLHELGKHSIAHTHEKAAKRFAKWARKSKYLPIASKMKLVFPRIYTLALSMVIKKQI